MNSISAAPPSSAEKAPASRREFLVAGAAVGTAVATAAVSWRLGGGTQSIARPLDQIIPSEVGSWSRANDDGVLIPRGEDPDERFYDDVATRYYTSPGAPAVMLLIAYGSAQTGQTQIHRPEVCYPAAGFRVRGSREVRLRLAAGVPLTAREMTATAPGRIEQILYWSRVGLEFPTDNLGQRWAVLRRTLSGAIPDGALVRMSLIDPNPVLGSAILENFADALVRSAGPDLARLMVGRA